MRKSSDRINDDYASEDMCPDKDISCPHLWCRKAILYYMGASHLRPGDRALAVQEEMASDQNANRPFKDCYVDYIQGLRKIESLPRFTGPNTTLMSLKKSLQLSRVGLHRTAPDLEEKRLGATRLACHAARRPSGLETLEIQVALF
ncbi:hypothetical protein RRG08_021389 [Elysia crispata]|uniref:Uncharacterized protein n=1 Tax=Elysia crispata TaxID=231223 RepID=A0AAE1BC46_9GAST|nr:hypothetical protein RRG08_021389 [Elysia crispata]